MGEILTTDYESQPSAQSPEQLGASDGPLTYRERIRRSVNSFAEGSMSLIDLGAGIALAHDDLRLTRQALHSLDAPYGGMLERQATDPMSVELRSDIIIDFRQEAQVAGFTDTDAMPDDARMEAAQAATSRYEAEMMAELTQQHPDWTIEELEAATLARMEDSATILGMNNHQQDELMHAQLQYHELRSANAEIQSELTELRAERNDRIARIGRTAMSGLINFAGKVRNAPNALSARAVVAGMSMGERMRSMAPEKRRTLVGSVAGLAVAGLAAYIAFRGGRAPGNSTASYMLAGAEGPLLPTGVGSTELPTSVGSSQLPSGVGEYTIPTGVGNEIPAGVGSDDIPVGVGSSPDALPTGVGEAPLPSGVGAHRTDLPSGVGEALPRSVGSDSAPLPSGVGSSGESAGSIHDSSDLFTSGSAEAIPNKIRVSEWDAKTLDGSLTGISRQMLVRSGVSSPSDTQIGALIDALRPQAQPNGYLLKGQELDLGPAKSALRSLLRK